jgi:hypothetical protein
MLIVRHDRLQFQWDRFWFGDICNDETAHSGKRSDRFIKTAAKLFFSFLIPAG